MLSDQAAYELAAAIRELADAVRGLRPAAETRRDGRRVAELIGDEAPTDHDQDGVPSAV
jgi:hypothetical protein